MRHYRIYRAFSLVVLAVAWAPSAHGLANRVFVSARSGNNLNACDNINTPCQTFAGAVTQLFPDGEVIVLDSGGYGPVTITKGVTIEAPAGVTAFVHPPAGDAITINAALTDKVTLRGLTLNGGTSNGIIVNSVGALDVEDCFITGFSNVGIEMLSAGKLNVNGTDIKASSIGVSLKNTTGLAQVAIDNCHLDGNGGGFHAGATAPGRSMTTAVYTTADNNGNDGWLLETLATGTNVLILEFCSGSTNVSDGVFGNAVNGVVRYSNCVFANNGGSGVAQGNSCIVQTRGNNTITGNHAATFGAITSFPGI